MSDDNRPMGLESHSEMICRLHRFFLGRSTPAGRLRSSFLSGRQLVNPLDNHRVTGVADALSKSAFVYPNPTTGMVSISGVWAAQSITLMDHTGRLPGSCNWGNRKWFTRDLAGGCGRSLPVVGEIS